LVANASVVCQDEDYYDDEDDEIRKGLTLGVGFGVGYSVHAESYEETLYGLHEFSGLRANIFDVKLGWRITNRLEVYGDAQLAPSNTTLSPYSSTYFGGTLAYYFKAIPSISLHGGTGKYKSNIRNLGPSGSGNLLSGKVSWQATENFYFDLRLLFGKMDKSNLEPNPFGTSELNVSFSVACRY